MKTPFLSVSLENLKRIDPRMHIVDALKIIAICDGSAPTDNDSFQEEEYPETAAWIRRCFNRPGDKSIRMLMLNEVLQTHGVDTIDNGISDDEIFAKYCNAGDLYVGTIALVGERFVITTLADLMEYLDWS